MHRVYNLLCLYNNFFDTFAHTVALERYEDIKESIEQI